MGNFLIFSNSINKLVGKLGLNKVAAHMFSGNSCTVESLAHVIFYKMKTYDRLEIIIVLGTRGD